ncbi:MAG TPA: multidrug efflux RND transporter permease subunit [Rickettsiales bacterium]|nr:multidrug efflux RND transporter permease subunit [Rickettsiales bacterium]
MNISALFIHRPVATTLLALGVVLSGIAAYWLLPVAPLPQVDFPTISVQVNLPGAGPETMASTVATPLERTLGRISGITEMTSISALGSTNIIVQFDLDRNIDGAARDVQAAINAARAMLPSGLPKNPVYRKVNPADSPIMIVTLTSQTMTQGELYDAASTVLAQKISQADGVGQVTVGGSALPAVRVELNPDALSKYGIALEKVRTAIAAANVNRPKGALESQDKRWQIYTNDQASRAKDYLPVIISYHNGAPVRIADVGTVTDSVQDIHNAGRSNGKTAIVLIIFKQPGANIIKTIENVKAMLPGLQASVPSAVDMKVTMERTATIKAALHDVELNLLISVALVIMVVLMFLRKLSSTAIPSVAVPVSLIGTFGIMYLCGYSLDNLSLMAITISTGFVVDDAIVVLENISRHVEEGVPPMQAALQGAKEVSFTVLSMSISLIAVFLPILLMGGIIGRLFREFAVTLSAAILVSLVVSLTLTPMMCARIIRKDEEGRRHGRLYYWCEHAFDYLHSHYKTTLDWALRHCRFILLLLFATIVLNIYLYVIVPKSFMPQQDSGRIIGSIQADQSISFIAMEKKFKDLMAIIMQDPAVDNVVGIVGGGQQSNNARMFISLKPLAERKISAEQFIARVRGKLNRVAGAKLYLRSSQDVRMGGRASNAEYQYTLQSDNLEDLRNWSDKIYKGMQEIPILTDVNTDQQERGVRTYVTYDRDTIYRLGLTPAIIDSTLNDAFGQRQVSTIYNPLNQYHVVMEVAPQYSQSADALKKLYVVSSSGAVIPFSSFCTVKEAPTALSVNHQGQFAAVTLSFNLPLGVSLSQASDAIEKLFVQLHVPSSIHGSFQGTAKVFKESFSTQNMLIIAALLTIYIVLGMLYESYIHPLTILSTLPSAGVGAILALMLFGIDFTLIAFIGVILLIGIVKKNAIMMIDFAIDVERTEGISSREAIFKACDLRFRPIMMTTMAALLGALPLAIGNGEGAELRQPLGISIVGGLMVSQVLTLYTTPVVYLYLDSLSLWWKKKFGRGNIEPNYPSHYHLSADN